MPEIKPKHPQDRKTVFETLSLPVAKILSPVARQARAINLSSLGIFLPNLAPGHLFMLGRLAVPKNIYVRSVGSPENTSNTGENPNINNLT